MSSWVHADPQEVSWDPWRDARQNSATVAASVPEPQPSAWSQYRPWFLQRPASHEPQPMQNEPHSIATPVTFGPVPPTPSAVPTQHIRGMRPIACQ